MWYPRENETIRITEHSIGQKVTIYPDAKAYPYDTNNEIKVLGEHVGCFKHYYRVLEDLCNSNAEYVSVMSDDIMFADNWQEIAVSKLSEDVGFVACYVPNGVKYRFKWTKGWYKLKGGWNTAYGGGYVFRRETALKMLKHPFMINHRDNYSKNQQIDHCVPEVAHRMGLKQMFYVPSLIKHIGYTSTIGHKHTKWEDVDW